MAACCDSLRNEGFTEGKYPAHVMDESSRSPAAAFGAFDFAAAPLHN